MKKGDFQVKQLFPFIACVALFAGLIAPVSAQTGTPGSGEAASTLAADVSIRFLDRVIYYPGNSPSEPVTIQLTITNRSPETIRFKLADDRIFSVDFRALTMKGMQLDHTATWLRKRSSNKHVYFREVSIEPGESFSFSENVKDYLSIAEPGIYVLDCAFYPELKRLSGDLEPVIRSNRLTLEVKPSPVASATRVLPLSPVTAEVLQPLPIPPDQVVSYVLTARQKSRWDQFFLYLDLEQMIARDPARGRRFKQGSERERYELLENYKFDLSQSIVDKDISTIPVDFRIERTSYTENEGEVTVIEWFDYNKFREKKRFTYYLSSRDGIWRVYDYKVDNLGTE